MPTSTPLRAVSPTEIVRRGRRLTFFGGCDYFRLSHHPAVQQAVVDGLKADGLSVAASRLTTGNHPIYAKAERAVARFFGAPEALVVGNGYATNLIVAQAHRGFFSRVFLDERAHLSLRDAAPLFEAPVETFPHANAAGLAKRIRASRGGRAVVLTDGMFSFNGSVAPLGAYQRLVPKTTWFIVDDCHGGGVIGRRGRGTLEHEGVARNRVIQTVTLSKAFGVHGGAILTPRGIRRRLIERSTVFLGSTAPPLPLMHAAITALGVLSDDSALRSRLALNVRRLWSALYFGGVIVEEQPGPIVSVTPRSASGAERVRRALLQAGVLPPLIRYPGSPRGGHFRFVISSEHTPEQLDTVASVLVAHRTALEES